MDQLDSEEIAPSEGLVTRTEDFTSSPDGNTTPVLMIRPDTAETLPAVVYFHGGSLQTNSCFEGIYRAWGRTIAGQGVVVAMVDFRNCLLPSEALEVAPYPAGLDDCVSSVRWLSGYAKEFGVDADRIVVAGESGGGNLTLATGMRLLKEGEIDRVHGLYALCPAM